MERAYMIHVLIERHIVDGMLSTYEKHARLNLQRTYVEPGFISGESFSDTDDPNHQFVLCRWRSAHDWKRWKQSNERGELMNRIRPILKQPERITLLEN